MMFLVNGKNYQQFHQEIFVKQEELNIYSLEI